MKTIKLIELFIKMANDEITPEKIRFNDNIYSHRYEDSNTYYYCKERNKVLEDDFILEELNKDVEILEDIPEEKYCKLLQRIDKAIKFMENTIVFDVPNKMTLNDTYIIDSENYKKLIKILKGEQQ